MLRSLVWFFLNIYVLTNLCGCVAAIIVSNVLRGADTSLLELSPNQEVN